MVEPCEVCGGDNSGFADFMTTCDQCKKHHVHTYCVDTNWICSECSEDVDRASDDSRKYNSSRKRGPEKRTVKFISAEEAINLSSGERQDCVNPQSRATSSHGSSRSTLMGRNISPPQGKWSNRPSVKPVGTKKSLANDSIQVKPLKFQRAPEPSSRLKESASPQAHVLKKKRIESPSSFHKHADKIRTYDANKEAGTIAAPAKIGEQSVDAYSPSKAFAFSNTRIKKVRDRTAFTYSKEAETPPTGASEAKNSGTESKDFLSFNAALKNYNGCFPADGIVSWRGGFYICNSSLHTQFYNLQGVAPSRVTRPLYNFLPKMPFQLLVKFDPRNKHWEDLFMNDCPGLDDVGLYFYPCESDRSKKEFSILYEFMKSKDLMIQGDIDNVVLLIFISDQLSSQSQSIMKSKGNESFLWCIFRKTKKNTDQALVKYVHDPAALDNAKVVDMEIDMVGGRDMGVVDIVVHTKSQPVQERPIRDEKKAA